MKKILTILGVIFLISTEVSAAECFKGPCGNPPPPPTKQEMAQREKAFEQRLGLSEEQKAQAKLLRKQGFEKIKPVIDKLKARENEFEMVKGSTLAQEEKDTKLNTLKEDIIGLKKQAHDIRKENMKEFESILTPEQKKIFKEMKQEGKRNFHEHHRPPVSK